MRGFGTAVSARPHLTIPVVVAIALIPVLRSDGYGATSVDVYRVHDITPNQRVSTWADPCGGAHRDAYVEVMAHRGASAYAPENTISSFQIAAALSADYLEMDVQRTSDGVLVVMHDETVDRTTNGTGRVADLTFAEIRRLDAGGWFGPVFAGQRVPTFREVLDLAREANVKVFPELKNPALYPGIEDQFLETLREGGMDKCAVVQSFDPNALGRLRALDPTIPLAQCFYPPARPTEPIAANSEIVCADANQILANPQLVQRAHDAGRRMWVYVVDDPVTATRLRALGVDGMFSDRPDAAQRWVQH